MTQEKGTHWENVERWGSETSVRKQCLSCKEVTLVCDDQACSLGTSEEGDGQLHKGKLKDAGLRRYQTSDFLSG